MHTFCTERKLPLDKDLGSIWVDFDGDVTLQDIKNAIDAAGHSAYCTYDNQCFVLKGSIHITGTNPGSLTVYNHSIILIHGSLQNNNPNMVLQFGRKDGDRCLDGCNFNTVGKAYLTFNNDDKAYNCRFAWPIGDESSQLAYFFPEEFIWGQRAGGVVIKNSNVEDFFRIAEWTSTLMPRTLGQSVGLLSEMG